MLCSLRDSAKGSPWSRAKRSLTACRLVMKSPSCCGVVIFSVGPGSPRPMPRRRGHGCGRAASTRSGGGSVAGGHVLDQPGLVEAYLQPLEEPVEQAAVAHL